MNPKANSNFYRWTAAALVLTAIAKLYSAGGSARILHVRDPLLHLGYRPVMILAALLEIAVAVFLFRGRSELRRSVALLWLTCSRVRHS
jgi:hypothetical protein